MHRNAALLLLLLLVAATAVADDKSGKAITTASSTIAPCGGEQAVAGVATPKENPKRTVFLGDFVTIWVCDLEAFLAEAQKNQQPVTLYIDGIDTGNEPVGIDHDQGSLTFVLDRNDKNKEMWRLRLYNPLFEPRQEIGLSVGRGGDRPLPRVSENANMRVMLDKVYVDPTVYLLLAFLAAVVIVVIWAARRTDMLRDGPRVGDTLQSYSLARVQMAWWFVMIVVAFAYLWIIMGDRDTIPPSLLGLMGISAVTAITSAALSSRSASRAESARKLLDAEREAIDATIARVDAEIQDTTMRMTAATSAGLSTDELVSLKADLLKIRAAREADRTKLVREIAGVTTSYRSSGFWSDLVTDDRGAVALDRLQIVVWTAVLGGVFAWTVAWELTMPEFNATLLALMGISSGTYIGFKIPQK